MSNNLKTETRHLLLSFRNNHFTVEATHVDDIKWLLKRLMRETHDRPFDEYVTKHLQKP